MIFVSVGTQLPFPRMIDIIDTWAGQHRTEKIVAQIAEKRALNYIEATDFLTANIFKKYISQADIIVSHAGMGNIITALEYGKPIIIFPRKAVLNEHRNDHQVATAKKFSNHPMVYVTEDFDSFTKVMQLASNLKTNKADRNKSNELIKLNNYLSGVVNEWFSR